MLVAWHAIAESKSKTSAPETALIAVSIDRPTLADFRRGGQLIATAATSYLFPMELETDADNRRTDGAAAFTKSGLARGAPRRGRAAESGSDVDEIELKKETDGSLGPWPKRGEWLALFLNLRCDK